MKQKIVAITTTVGRAAEAKRLAKRIVEARLASCVQSFPVTSIYRWKGKVESASEFVLVAKTRRSLAGRLIKFIRAEHSYELPEIIETAISGGLAGYLNWVINETEQDS